MNPRGEDSLRVNCVVEYCPRIFFIYFVPQDPLLLFTVWDPYKAVMHVVIHTMMRPRGRNDRGV